MSILEELTFTPTETEFCVDVIVIDDEVIETLEQFSLSPSSDNPDVTFTNSPVPVRITDSSSKFTCRYITIIQHKLSCTDNLKYYVCY